MAADANEEQPILSMARQMRERCKASSVPLYYLVGGELVPLGTGTLLAVADRRFLVTAVHVAQAARNDGDGLYVASGLESLKIRPVKNCTMALLKDGRIDVAIIDLNDDVTTHLSSDTFVRLSDMSFEEFDRRGVFYWSGYPREVNESIRHDGDHTQGPTFIGFAGGVYNGELTNESYDPPRHLLIDVDRRILEHDPEDNIAFPTTLNGVSGAGIWKTYNEACATGEWTAAKAKMVAVETMVYGDRPHRIVRGTHVAAIPKMLWNRFEDLRPSITLHCPGLALVEGQL